MENEQYSIFYYILIYNLLDRYITWIIIFNKHTYSVSILISIVKFYCKLDFSEYKQETSSYLLRVLCYNYILI